MNAVLHIISDEPMMRQVPYWEVKANWAKYAPILQRVIERQDEWSLQGLYEKLIQPPIDISAMQLWVIGETSCLVTQINYFPMTGVRKCLLFMAAGEKAHSACEFHSQVESWAREYYKLIPGKDKMLIWGRRGWEPHLKTLGYSVKTICFEKTL